MLVEGCNGRSDSGRKDQGDVGRKLEKSDGNGQRNDQEEDRDESEDKFYVFPFVRHFLAFRK